MVGERVELVFVPHPSMGHLVPTVEVAKRLLRHCHRLSITIIILKLPFHSDITSYTDTLSASTGGINFVTVLLYEHGEALKLADPNDLLRRIEEKKDSVKEAVDRIVSEFRPGAGSPRLAGFVMDMFCTSMIDVANEFGVPSYVLYTSPAAFLAFHLYSHQLITKSPALKNSDLLDMPMFRHRFPAKLLPTFAFFPESAKEFIKATGRYGETKGIIVNTFEELESYAIPAASNLDQKIPTVYPVGPVLNLDSHDWREKNDDVMTWLGDQPPISVVFLCFGSSGSFYMEQVMEIATALERSGQRFLWSLRRQPAPKRSQKIMPSSTDLDEDFEGFLNRTAAIGKVIGWASQAAILGHPAVGGFVSHCGWNSTLESLWFGVPMAAWPIYAEQQFNAFEVVVELALGVEVRMDYRKEPPTAEANMIVRAAEIERAIKLLMEKESEVRKRVKEMSHKSRKAVAEGGSSHSNLVRFLQDMMVNTEDD